MLLAGVRDYQPRHKKKFISKKNAVTFHLVHRSQQDPLIVDEKAPQRVLVPEGKRPKSKKDIEEEQKYGIFFDDDYNYLQHLRSTEESSVSWEQVNHNSEDSLKKSKEKKSVQLPSSVFASHVEEPVGLLNRAPPVSGLRLDLDPEVIAALDDDFDFSDPENVLEDNFVELANRIDDTIEEEPENYNSEEEDEVASWPSEPRFSEEETRSRFTNYSLTSSVIRRNDQLSLLDDRFEQMFSGYEESEIGALECEDIEGHLKPDDELLLRLAEDFKKNSQRKDEGDLCKDKILSVISEDSDEEEMEDLIIGEKEEKWDCESILSTYSNIYNHPAKIVEPKVPKIRVSKTTGIPLDVIGENKLTASALAKLNDIDEKPSGPRSVISQLSELSIRSKDETPEEKKRRKQALKIYRRERRIERKANTDAFKEEKKRQEKVLLNLKLNLQGIKIN